MTLNLEAHAQELLEDIFCVPLSKRYLSKGLTRVEAGQGLIQRKLWTCGSHSRPASCSLFSGASEWGCSRTIAKAQQWYCHGGPEKYLWAEKKQRTAGLCERWNCTPTDGCQTSKGYGTQRPGMEPAVEFFLREIYNPAVFCLECGRGQTGIINWPSFNYGGARGSLSTRWGGLKKQSPSTPTVI